MEVIKTENITKVYNSSHIPVNALNGVSIAIDKKEFTAIVGPSGSGKTTLLNIIGGRPQPHRAPVPSSLHGRRLP